MAAKKFQSSRDWEKARKGAAKEVGEFLGGILANLVGENSDEIASGLGESLSVDAQGLKHLEVVREGSVVRPSNEAEEVMLEEALSYVRDAVKPVIVKALSQWLQTER